MARWTFIRHGATEANLQQRLTGREDIPLTHQGRMEVLQAGAALARQPPPTRVLASDLLRTRQTALGLSVAAGWGLSEPGGPAFTFTPDLRERDLGAWGGEKLQVLRADGRAHTVLSWRGRPPGGESLEDVARRVLPFLAQADDPAHPHTVVVTHGGVLRVLLGLLDGTPIHKLGMARVLNCDPTPRDLPPGALRSLAARLDLLKAESGEPRVG